jgi:ribosomal protein S18 acetylase RimI-like enzyme
MPTSIRKYHPRDEKHIQEITYRTGFKGRDLTGMNYFNDARLWFLIFIYYYTRYEPEHCFVAVDTANDQPIGFVCGTPDTKAQEQRFNRKIIPRLILRGFLYTSWRYPRAFHSLLKMIPMREPQDEQAANQLIEQYPSHLHINLLPEYHHQGIGSQLIITFEDHLRNLGVPGLHLHTTNHNTKAVPFYEKHGYSIIRKDGPVPHPLLDDFYLLTFAKSLE